jgi:hypothetical protein
MTPATRKKCKFDSCDLIIFCRVSLYLKNSLLISRMEQQTANSIYTVNNLNQCCGSGMFITDPESPILIFTHPISWIPDLGSRIPDPKTATKERGDLGQFSKNY